MQLCDNSSMKDEELMIPLTVLIVDKQTIKDRNVDKFQLL